jgi:PAS domain S-box-containing protein
MLDDNTTHSDDSFDAAEEVKRQAVLDSYAVLDTLPEKELDALTQLAANICDRPIALITLIDKDRQWFKSTYGILGSQTSRETSFCQYTIRHHSPLEIKDARLDMRVNTNPYVTGDPHIRYYCGVPLTSPEGYNIGSLCVVDHVAAELTEKQKAGLQTLAGEVMARLELRRQKKQLEAEKRKLAESEKRYKALVENSEGYIFTHDLHGNLLSVNPKMAQALEYVPSELKDKNLLDLINAETFDFDTYLQQIRHENVVHGIMRVKTQSFQERFWVYRNFKYTDDEGKCYVICSAQDITDKELAQQLLEKAKIELQIKVESRTKQLLALNNALAKAKTNLDTLIYRASHDLLGPLCSLKGLLNVARQDTNFANQDRYLDLMYGTTEKLENILSNLLSYSNNTHHSLFFKQVDFQKIVDNSIQACSHIASHNRVLFRSDIQADVPFFSDEERLLKIFTCLFSNSIIFQNIHNSNPFIHVRIACSEEKASIYIEDNGIGIPAATLSTVFDMFAKSAIHSNGPGLGLFIVKEIIAKLNGNIEVSSAEGKGTVFTIEIPNRQAEQMTNNTDNKV